MDGLVLDLGSGSGQEFMRGFDVECSSRADKHVSVSVFRPGQRAPLSQWGPLIFYNCCENYGLTDTVSLGPCSQSDHGALFNDRSRLDSSLFKLRAIDNPHNTADTTHSPVCQTMANRLFATTGGPSRPQSQPPRSSILTFKGKTKWFTMKAKQEELK